MVFNAYLGLSPTTKPNFPNKDSMFLFTIFLAITNFNFEATWLLVDRFREYFFARTNWATRRMSKKPRIINVSKSIFDDGRFRNIDNGSKILLKTEFEEITKHFEEKCNNTEQHPFQEDDRDEDFGFDIIDNNQAPKDEKICKETTFQNRWFWNPFKTFF